MCGYYAQFRIGKNQKKNTKKGLSSEMFGNTLPRPLIGNKGPRY